MPRARRYHQLQTCLGIWQIAVDWEAGTLEIAPMREASKALNALNLLEPPPGKFLKVKMSTLVIDEGKPRNPLRRHHPTPGATV